MGRPSKPRSQRLGIRRRCLGPRHAIGSHPEKGHLTSMAWSLCFDFASGRARGLRRRLGRRLRRRLRRSLCLIQGSEDGGGGGAIENRLTDVAVDDLAVAGAQHEGRGDGDRPIGHLDAELADDAQLGIDGQRISQLQPARQLAAFVERVGADSQKRRLAAADLRKELLQLPELPTTEQSPMAAVKDKDERPLRKRRLRTLRAERAVEKRRRCRRLQRQRRASRLQPAGRQRRGEQGGADEQRDGVSKAHQTQPIRQRQRGQASHEG